MPRIAVFASDGESLRSKLARGETAYLAGLGIAGHNSGAALVEVSEQHGVDFCRTTKKSDSRASNTSAATRNKVSSRSSSGWRVWGLGRAICMPFC